MFPIYFAPSDSLISIPSNFGSPFSLAVRLSQSLFFKFFQHISIVSIWYASMTVASLNFKLTSMLSTTSSQSKGRPCLLCCNYSTWKHGIYSRTNPWFYDFIECLFYIASGFSLNNVFYLPYKSIKGASCTLKYYRTIISSKNLTMVRVYQRF